MKLCINCNKKKPIEEFHNNKRHLDGKQIYCKSCAKIVRRESYLRRRDKALLYQHNYHKQHYKSIEKNYEYDKITNFKDMKDYMRQYVAKRRQLDMNFRLINNVRVRLRDALRQNHKTGTTIDLLGCSIEALKIHLESKWQEGMTWENYGKTGWHIDHIKPLSSFDLTNSFQLSKACHFTNLQPLWAKDNLSKGSKIGLDF